MAPKLLPRHYGELLSGCKLLLHLLRVNEFMADRFTRVEPSHDCLRLRGTTLRQTEDRVVSYLRTLRTNCEKRRNQHAAIGVEDADYKMIVSLVWQLENVRTRRQHASGDLNRLAEGDPGFLISLVCVCDWQNDHDGKHKQDGDDTLDDGNSLHNSSFFVVLRPTAARNPLLCD